MDYPIGIYLLRDNYSALVYLVVSLDSKLILSICRVYTQSVLNTSDAASRANTCCTYAGKRLKLSGQTLQMPNRIFHIWIRLQDLQAFLAWGESSVCLIIILYTIECSGPLIYSKIKTSYYSGVAVVARERGTMDQWWSDRVSPLLQLPTKPQTIDIKLFQLFRAKLLSVEYGVSMDTSLYCVSVFILYFVHWNTAIMWGAFATVGP